MIRVLGIETSCDECSVSVLEFEAGHLLVRSLVTASQVETHAAYGGVVPEVASREHLESMLPVIERALADAGSDLDQIDVIASTNRPGLAGALLVGVTASKTLAYATGKPLVPVHHLEGHIASIFLDRPEGTALATPCVVAVVSGGHTELYCLPCAPELWPLDLLSTQRMGRSRDDAAGEAFDKIAKRMGFPYPGGVWIDKTSKGGNPAAFKLPRALTKDPGFDFSFSGLKTAAALTIEQLEKEGTLEEKLSDLCASAQEAIVDAIIHKSIAAIKHAGARSFALVGGVAANSRLRERLHAELARLDRPVELVLPKLRYCSDNGAMIAAAGLFRFLQGHHLSGSRVTEVQAIPYTEV